MEDITQMLGLLEGEHSSFTISYNDEHACNYVNAREYSEGFSGGYSEKDFVSLDEYRRAMDGNSVWCAHWCPRTPVGFCRVYASSLPALMAYIREASGVATDG